MDIVTIAYGISKHLDHNFEGIAELCKNRNLLD